MRVTETERECNRNEKDESRGRVCVRGEGDGVRVREMERRKAGSRAVSPLQVGPPVASSPPDRSPHLRSRSATRSRPFAVQSSSKQTCVNSNNPIRSRMSKASSQTQNLRAEPSIISARHPW